MNENHPLSENLAVELGQIRTSQSQKKVFQKESEEISHQQRADSVHRKKGQDAECHQTSLWRLVQVLTDESLAKFTHVAFEQCEDNARCSRQHVADLYSHCSTDAEPVGGRVLNSAYVSLNHDQVSSTECGEKKWKDTTATEPSHNPQEVLLLR